MRTIIETFDVIYLSINLFRVIFYDLVLIQLSPPPPSAVFEANSYFNLNRNSKTNANAIVI